MFLNVHFQQLKMFIRLEFIINSTEGILTYIITRKKKSLEYLKTSD